MALKDHETATDIAVQVEADSDEEDAGNQMSTRTSKIVLDDAFIALNAVLDTVPREQHITVVKQHYFRAWFRFVARGVNGGRADPRVLREGLQRQDF